MLTDQQQEMLVAMQCITVPEGTSISVEDNDLVWEWADCVLKTHRRLLRKAGPHLASKQQESTEAAYRQLMEVLAGRAGIHVVNGKVRICPLDELPRDRVDLFQEALGELFKAGSTD